MRGKNPGTNVLALMPYFASLDARYKENCRIAALPQESMAVGPISRSKYISKLGAKWLKLDLDIGPTAVLSCGKAAIMQFSSYLASREAKYGIRANTLIPGFFPRKGPVERLDYMDQIHSKTPLRRIGKLEDFVAPVAFLLSGGSGFYTGQSLIVDGGYSIW